MPTIKKTLTDTAWSYLGTGSMEIHPIGGIIVIATGQATPASMMGLPFEGGLRKRITTSESVFARSYGNSGLVSASGDGVGGASPPVIAPTPTLKRRNIDLSAGQSKTMADFKAIFINQVTAIEAVKASDKAFVKFYDGAGGEDENWQDAITRLANEPPFDDAMKWEAVGGDITLNVTGW